LLLIASILVLGTAAGVALIVTPSARTALASLTAAFSPGHNTTADAVLPDVIITKTASVPSFSAAGQVITYNVQITNTGTSNINQLAVSDLRHGVRTPPLECPRSQLGPLSTMHCSFVYMTTDADVHAGQVTDVAIVFGQRIVQGPNIEGEATSPALTIPFREGGAIGILKRATPDDFTAVGETITYTYLVTNAGTVPLHGITVTDSRGLAVNCHGVTMLQPHASTTCTATHATTSEDVQRGSISNVGIVEGTDPHGHKVTDSDSILIGFRPAAIAINKRAFPDAYSGPGQTITYTYTVINPSDVTLHNIVVTDSNNLTLNCNGTTLEPGAFMLCTGIHTTTDDDVGRGSITDTATAVGTTPGGSRVTDTSPSFTVTLERTPRLALQKVASALTFSDAGQQIIYTYQVANDGNVPISGVVIHDSRFPGVVACSIGDLPVGVTGSCTRAYASTAADVAAGSVDNTATAEGTGPTGPVTSNPSSVSVGLVRQPALGLAKTAGTSTFSDAGQQIIYTYQVTNDGDAPVNGVVIHDSRFPDQVACTIGNLPVGPTVVTCTSTYTTTAADVTAGAVVNTATASGTTPGGIAVTSPQQSTTVTLSRQPALGLAKTASTSTFSDAGQQIIYTYQVTNDGDAPVNGVVIHDSRFPDQVACTIGNLPVGPTVVTCTRAYTTTAADVTAGAVVNTATASGTTPGGIAVTSPERGLTIPLEHRPVLSIAKRASVTSFSAANTTITYTFTVTNTGNVPLTSVHITDTKLGTLNCPGTLALNQTATCPVGYVTTATDVANGHITNTAVATGTPPSGSEITSNEYGLTIPLNHQPGLSITKEASVDTFSDPGLEITYTFTVTNTGNVPLTAVDITDTKLGTIDCPADLGLGLGQTATCHATYLTTTADVANGHITNTAVATGTPPSGIQVTSNEYGLTIPLEHQPGLFVFKEANVDFFNAAGLEIIYTILVTNTGNVPLTNVHIADSLLGAIDCPGALAVDETATCQATYITTAADVASGTITNSADATGTAPSGEEVISRARAALIIELEHEPGLSITKRASVTSFSAAGLEIVYTFQVTNRGNVPLTNVHITDTKLGTINCPGTLVLNQTAPCRATYITTPTDVANGHITNSAVATGTPPEAAAINSQAYGLTIPLEPQPGLSITKEASVTSFNAAGTPITYTFRVTNEGNTVLNNVTVTDSLGIPVLCPATSLAVDEEMECGASYVTTQADANRGSVVNTATVTGLTPGGATVTGEDSLSIAAVHAPGLSIAKTASTLDFSKPGTVVTYFYEVTNTGNVTLNPVTVDDSRLGRITCPQSVLAPGERMICTAIHVVTAAEVGQGSLSNTATATGRTPAGVVITAISTEVLPVSPIPGPVVPVTVTG
jgi:uncharacterized repeat protein (TIGR01451 family)